MIERPEGSKTALRTPRATHGKVDIIVHTNHAKSIEAGKPPEPQCSECGRLITAGAATADVNNCLRWLCEYCLIVDSFRLA